jgi:hypothetical protein
VYALPSDRGAGFGSSGNGFREPALVQANIAQIAKIGRVLWADADRFAETLLGFQTLARTSKGGAQVGVSVMVIGIQGDGFSKFRDRFHGGQS